MKTTLPTTLKHFLLVMLVFCTSAAALAQNNSPITGFVLVNADTGEDLVSLTEGIQLDQCEFASLSLSIRALIDPNRQNEVQSVFLAIDGPEDAAYGRTENVAPYALFGDLNSMFNGRMFLQGKYALKAVPYSEVNAGGEEGERLNINISFAIDLPAVSSQFELIDATTNTVISSLSDGAIIDNAITTTTNVSLRAIVNADCHPNIASVFLKLDGPVNYGRTENLEAYALFGDVDGDFIGRDLPAGSYTFSVIPYTEDNAGGIRGETISYAFEVVEKDTSGLTFVPDDNLEQFFIRTGFDDVLDDYILTENLENVTALFASGVADRTGLEACINLTTFDCAGCNLDALDLSLFPQLNQLRLLTPSSTDHRIDLSKAPLLELIEFAFMDFVELDLSPLTELNDLEVYNTRLSSQTHLDLSQNTNLEIISFQENSFETINLNNNNNQNLQRVDFRGNPLLQCLQVDDVDLAINSQNWLLDTPEALSEDCFPDNDGLTFLPDDTLEQYFIDQGLDDVLDDFVLTVNMTQITELNVGAVADFTGLEQAINLSSISLESLSGNLNQDLGTVLENFSLLMDLRLSMANDVSENILEQLRLNNPNLTSLYLLGSSPFGRTAVERMDFSGLPELKNLGLESLTVENLNVSPLNNLETLDIFLLPKLEILDLIGNSELTRVDILFSDQIKELNLTENRNLIELRLSGLTNLERLDVSNSELLEEVAISTNSALNELDFSSNANLKDVQLFQLDNLVSVNLRNETNIDIDQVFFSENPSLACLQVDNVAFVLNNPNWRVEDPSVYSEECFPGDNDLTYVPDDNLEQFFIDQGLDDVLDDFVLTENIRAIRSIDVSNVSDVTGLEAAQELRSLSCNQCSFESPLMLSNVLLENLQLLQLRIPALNGIDLSLLVNLKELNLDNINFIENLDISNTNLEILNIGGAQTLIADNLINLKEFSIRNTVSNLSIKNSGLQVLNLNQKSGDGTIETTSLDCSSSLKLEQLKVQGEPFLDVGWGILNATNCPALNCIEVDDISDAISAVFNVGSWQVDNTELFSLFCGSSTTDEIMLKNSFKIIDLTSNEVLAIVENGDEIDFNLVDGKAICVEVEPTEASADKTKKVRITLDGPSATTNFPGTPPYRACVLGDGSLQDSRLILKSGIYKLQGFPFNEANEIGIITTINFTIGSGNTEDLTFIPDDRLEQYMIINRFDDVLDNYVRTDFLSGVTRISISGVEDFTGFDSLINLDFFSCTDCTSETGFKPTNPKLSTIILFGKIASSLNFSDNDILDRLRIRGEGNSDTSNTVEINLQDTRALSVLDIRGVSMPALNLETNKELTRISLNEVRSIGDLDLSSNNKLSIIDLNRNTFLRAINLKNGENDNITSIVIGENPLLNCIQVDDVMYARENLEIDNIDLFSADCYDNRPNDGEDILTFVPDDNLEQYFIDNFLDDILDNYVVTNALAQPTSISIEEVDDFTGLEDCINLRSIICTGCNVQEFNLTNPNLSLMELKFGEVFSRSLSFKDMPNLTSLVLTAGKTNNQSDLRVDLRGSNIDSFTISDSRINELELPLNLRVLTLREVDGISEPLDLKSYDKLEGVFISDTAIPSIELPNERLKNLLFINVEGIEVLDLKSSDKLESVIILGASLTSIEFPNEPENLLGSALIRNTNVSVLDLSSNPSLTRVTLNDNPNLEFINLKNGQNRNLNKSPETFNMLPSLTCIQIDDLEYAISNFPISDPSVYSEDCFDLNTAGSITGFQRVSKNADLIDGPFGPLEDGYITVRTFSGGDLDDDYANGDFFLDLSISALTDGNVKSVVFEMTHSESNDEPYTFTANEAPFLLFGKDENGVHIVRNYFTEGRYTLKATPYNQNNGNGNAGEPYEISFILSDYSPSISPFANVIDAETDEQTGFIGACCGASSDTVNPMEDNIENVNFEVIYRVGEPTSVTFVLEGPMEHTFTDNTAPFTLFGDTDGDYNGMSLPYGNYIMHTIAEFDNEREWRPITQRSIHFTVSEESYYSKTPSFPKPLMYPNPSKDQITIDMVEGTPRNDIRIVDIYGKQVKKVAAQTGSNQIDVSTLSPGIYFILTETDLGTSRQKLIVQ